MFELNGRDSYQLISRIEEVSRIIIKPPVQVVTDTTEFTRLIHGPPLFGWKVEDFSYPATVLNLVLDWRNNRNFGSSKATTWTVAGW